MTLNYTLIKAEHDFDTHVSTTVISTDIGLFSATSFCQKPDRKYESKYFGCRIAEWKAIRNYARTKRALAKAEVNALEKYANRMSHTRNFKETDYYNKLLNKEIAVAKEAVAKWEREIVMIGEVIKEEIAERDKSMAEVLKK